MKRSDVKWKKTTTDGQVQKRSISNDRKVKNIFCKRQKKRPNLKKQQNLFFNALGFYANKIFLSSLLHIYNIQIIMAVDAPPQISMFLPNSQTLLSYENNRKTLIMRGTFFCLQKNLLSFILTRIVPYTVFGKTQDCSNLKPREIMTYILSLAT